MKIEDIDDLGLLTACIIGEAAGEPFVGKLAIACVVRNRKEKPDRWPNTWKDVILQPQQFSCFNHLPREGEIPITFVHRMFMTQREAKFAAWGVLNDYYGDITNGSNHYFNPDLDFDPDTPDELPYWVGQNEPCFEVGLHKFYNL